METTISRLRAYAVSVANSGWPATTVHARSAGKAKYDHWRDVTESWPDLPITAMRARVIGPPEASEGFKRNAKYRGIEFAKPGMRVKVAGKFGVIVSHNDSANLSVLMDETGVTWNCHPHSEITYFDEAGKVIRSYNIRGEIQ